MSRFNKPRGALCAVVISGAGLVPAAMAATASAAIQPATLAVDQACYVITKTQPTITITGSGYAPGDMVAVTDGTGSIDTMTPANSAGQISVAVQAPIPTLSAPGEKADIITADDLTAAGAEIRGTTTAELTTVAAGNTGTKQRPGLQAFTESTKWSFSGFPTGRTVYGHYTYEGRQTALQSFGRASGPCGLLTVRKRLYPATPHHMTYRLQVDGHRKYSKHTEPALHLKLSLTFL